MSSKQIAAATALALVTLVVFGWSTVMAAMGHAALIAVLAPVLGLTVVQVLRGVRSRTASGHRVTVVPDEEDSAP
ncbi:hypothetical protein [Streptomyces jumonjinensis]|uniref:Uncharacterized protein n=1 Tax=Streptomyces jumonjinensis TaxID=1945 RepID=A0A646KKJ7_STRJU|nr:hypothetical protein [Streptomyces jumonjinensis]MQT02753.1 hypothetical protein [Streptomyces jumonjinensis]